MLLRVSIYSIFLVLVLMRYILPNERPEIIPFPQQSVSDKGDFRFKKSTLISVENKRQWIIVKELTDLFNTAAGFTPEIAIKEKYADILFQTDTKLPEEHYKLNISPSCILVEASGEKGFFYAIQTLRFLLPPAINSRTPVKDVQWNVPGMTIQDGPQHSKRTIVLHTPFHLIPENNLKELINYMAMLKINELHFIQKPHETTSEDSQRLKKMNLYAKSKKITISSGTIQSENIASNLPFHMERLMTQTDFFEIKECKQQLFRQLASIAEKCWSYPLCTDKTDEFSKRLNILALHMD